jgi:sporulation protein YlmC with PRC-barrel domain
MGTQVITRDTGRRLGVVGEVVVDIDRREVVALGLRDNPLTRFLPGLPRWMPLDRIRQVGDVILVDSVDSLAEGFNPERYSKVINCQVITESGAQLGRVLGFSFDIETGELTTLVIGALGVPLLGEGVLSTWEMPVGEVVSSGPDRIIVYEGAEEKLKQLGTGLLEKLGIGGSSWEQEERERFRSGVVPAENQLPAGQPTALEQRRIQPAASRAFQPAEELEYVELEERREREPLRQRRYLDDDLGEPPPRPEPRTAPAEPYGREPYEREPYEHEPYGRQPYRRDSFGPERGDRDRFSERQDDRDYRERGQDDRDYPERAPRETDRQRTEREPLRVQREPERPERDSLRSEREPLRAERTESPAPRPREPREPVDVEPEILDDPW